MKKPGLAALFGLLLVSGGCAPDTLTAPPSPSATVIRDARGRAVGTPLIVLDGRVLGRGGEVANDVDPNEILNLEILKGDRAVLAWGAEAADGVVIITTKKAAAAR